MRNKIFRNVMLVTFGSACSQVIGFIFVPFITRIYGPEAFGLFGAFISVINILAPISALCFPLAIVLPREEAVALKLAKLSFYATLFFISAIAIILLFAKELLLDLLRLKDINNLIYFVPILVLLSSLIQILNNLTIRRKLFKFMSKANIIQAFASNISKTGIGWFFPHVWVLITSVALGYLVHASVLYKAVKAFLIKKIGKPNDLKISSMFELAKKYSAFPKYRAPQKSISAVSESLPVILLNIFFGPQSAGHYAIARTVIGLPSVLIGRSFFDVLYPELVDASNNQKNMLSLLKRFSFVSGTVGFAFYCPIIIFGPGLFDYVFGTEWFEAGIYARWLAFAALISFFNLPSAVAVSVFGLQKGMLYNELLGTAAKMGALYLGFAVFMDDRTAVALFASMGALSYSLLTAWVFFRISKLRVTSK